MTRMTRVKTHCSSYATHKSAKRDQTNAIASTVDGGDL
jgi:hypothetical protein